MLYLIGLGINRNHITLGAIEAAKKCEELYLESYTSIGLSVEELEKLFDKKITKVDRDFVENFDVSLAKDKNIGILIYGDIFSATTHVSLLLDCKKQDINIELVNSVSILTLIGNTGLNLYNFGKVISIPFQDVDLMKGLKDNGDLHTLFLLDLNPKENKFVSINEALKRLLDQGMDDMLCVGIERLGFDEKIVVKKAKELINVEFSKYPQCLIVVGKLHFVEEEVIHEISNRS
jgi:diphthine synthase